MDSDLCGTSLMLRSPKSKVLVGDVGQSPLFNIFTSNRVKQ